MPTRELFCITLSPSLHYRGTPTQTWSVVSPGSPSSFCLMAYSDYKLGLTPSSLCLLSVQCYFNLRYRDRLSLTLFILPTRGQSSALSTTRTLAPSSSGGTGNTGPSRENNISISGRSTELEFQTTTIITNRSKAR